MRTKSRFNKVGKKQVIIMCQKEMCENPNCDSTKFYKTKGAGEVEYSLSVSTLTRFAYTL